MDSIARRRTVNAARMELKLVLDEAGISEVNLDTFSRRFNIQKRIYLIQLMGDDLGYRYGWYIRGPYCRELTADAFTLRDEILSGENDYEGFELEASSKERIKRARRLWEIPPGSSVLEDEWLELLASLHYLKHIAYWPKPSKKDFEAVFKALIGAKPRFTNAKRAAQQAWRRLHEFGLIDAKTLS
jgi:uncharacterized protein YwgA